MWDKFERGGNVAPRRVCAVLELAYPYLAVLKREFDTGNGAHG